MHINTDGPGYRNSQTDAHITACQQLRRLLLFAGLCTSLLIGAAACNTTQPVTTEAGIPPALILNDHPLANRIYDVRAGRFTSEDELYKRLADAGYILVGETHDNTEQHRVRRQLK